MLRHVSDSRQAGVIGTWPERRNDLVEQLRSEVWKLKDMEKMKYGNGKIRDSEIQRNILPFYCGGPEKGQ